MKCPLCGYQKFFVKAPEDEYETYEFELRDGRPEFGVAAGSSECPEVHDGTETFCERCSWHGKFKELKKSTD